MDTPVCHSNPIRWAVLLAFSVSLLGAQTWRKIGKAAVDTGLAGPTGGPVSLVWFSEDGNQLFARTTRGLTFATADFESWAAAPQASLRPGNSTEPGGISLPEPKASLRSGGAGRLYAFGAYVYSSDNSGRTWNNLVAFNGRSVIGAGQRDLAVSPRDAQLVAVANDAGVWCSHDGGLSWSGLNEGLPNLPVQALLAGNRILVEGVGAATLAGHAGWVAAPREQSDFAQLSVKLGTTVTASAGSGELWYAGAQDGRMWTSADGKAHWTLASVQAAGPVERFFLDPEAPRIAFAAASGRGAHLFRTVNGGQTWFDITGTLAATHGIAADRASGAVYAATDAGVFLSRMDLNVLGTASPWVGISADLPMGAIAKDVRLEGSQLRVALDGWGVYTTRAPHEAGTAKLVNAADLSTRAAAPGGLVSAVGILVESATAGERSFPVLARSQIQIPFGTKPSELQLEVNRNLKVGLTVKAVSPAVFVDRDGAPLLLDAETGMMLSGVSAVLARSSVQFLATGFGQVTPEWPSGVPAPAIEVPVVTADVHAFLNGVSIEVMKATLAPGYVGMYLVEVRLPSLLDEGIADFYVEAGGEQSNHVHLNIAY